MSSCRRRTAAAAAAASTRLPTVATLLLIFSLLLVFEDNRAVADARHVKSSPTSTPAAAANADSSSSRVNGGLKGVEKTKKRPLVEAVEVKAAPSKGNYIEGDDEQQSFGSSSDIGNGGRSTADKIVVVQRRGPTPHPKKHN